MAFSVACHNFCLFYLPSVVCCLLWFLRKYRPYLCRDRVLFSRYLQSHAAVAERLFHSTICGENMRDCLNYMQILDRCVNFAQSNPACKFAASFDT